MRFRLTLKEPQPGQDNYFLWSMVLLPILAEVAYICDAYYLLSAPEHFHYAGLFSTILIVFAYLRYGAPIENAKILAIYYIILCVLNEVGTIGYLIVYFREKNICGIIIYIGWGILELIMTGCLIYYRCIKKCHPKFHLESKNLFQFIARLEIILAIFIPFFYTNRSTLLTKHSIAFFLLFEYFAESYHQFHGYWIKPILYLFVCTVTVCVATEWIYATEQLLVEEIISAIFGLISACLCDILIILQFTSYHFRAIEVADIARIALAFQRSQPDSQPVQTNLQTIDVDKLPAVEKIVSNDTVIDVEF